MQVPGGVWIIQKRYFISIWTALGCVLLCLMRSNLVIALVEMTSNKTIVVGNKTEILNPEFPMDMEEKGFILSAFSFGYGFAFMLGFLVYKFGGVTMFGLGVVLTGILAVLSPILIRTHLSAFLLARILQGLLEGLAYTAVVDIFTHWAPPAERTRLVSSAKIGVLCGVAINYPISGYVAHHWGWEAIFYQSGGITLIWYFIWITTISNDPSDDRFISEEERSYLKNVIPDVSNKKTPVPWKQMLSSLPVYALFNEFLTIGWTYSFVTYNLPLYVKDMLNVNTQDVGLITGIPMLCGVIAIILGAWAADCLRSRFSISKVHKHVIFWSELSALVSILIATFSGNFLICIICFSVLRMAFSVADTSYGVICIDMAGQFSGVLFSICASLGSVGCFFSPLVLGYMVQNNTQSEWNQYFLFLSIITMYGVFMFCIFGSAELETWAVVNEEKDANIQNHEPQLQINQCTSHDSIGMEQVFLFLYNIIAVVSSCFVPLARVNYNREQLRRIEKIPVTETPQPLYVVESNSMRKIPPVTREILVAELSCSTMQVPGGIWIIPKRYFISIWTALGGVLLCLMRSNLVIALVEMTSNKTIVVGNKTEILNPEFPMDMEEKGFILSAFSFGYSFAFTLGFLIYKFGGVTMFGLGVVLTGILAVLSPILIRTHLFAFLLARILQGLLEGLALTAVVDIFTHWAPPAERTRLASSSRIGILCGVAINYPLSGYVAHHWGWEAIFYQSGGITLIWYLIWITTISNDPSDDRFISEEERSYLKNAIPNVSTKKTPIPWKKMLSSLPVYALFNEYLTVAWTYSFVTYNLPLYVKDMLNVNTQDVGLITGIPMLCGVIAIILGAWAADCLRSRFSISKVHKHVIFWSELSVLVALLIATFSGNFLICIICFSVLRVAFSVADTSYGVICIDMAGQFSGVLYSIGVSLSSVGCFFNPLVLGYMVQDNTQSEWNQYFLFLSIITMYGVIMFCIFGSAELQTWAVVNDEKDANIQNHEAQLEISQCSSHG